MKHCIGNIGDRQNGGLIRFRETMDRSQTIETIPVWDIYSFVYFYLFSHST